MNFEACLTNVMNVKNEIKSFISSRPNLQTALAEIAKLQPMFKELLSTCSFKPFFLDYDPTVLNDASNSDVPLPPGETPVVQLNIFKCIGAAANLAGPIVQIVAAGAAKDINGIINGLNTVVNSLDGLIQGCFKS